MTTPILNTRAGHPLPLGPTWHESGINIALFCRQGRSVSLIYRLLDSDQLREMRLDPVRNKTGDIWHIFLDTGGKPLSYGFRIEPGHGSAEPAADADCIAVDPYCREQVPRGWGVDSAAGREPVCLARQGHEFDWRGDRPPRIPAAETIIYELHVRGFTHHPSSLVAHPGTFLGLAEKIPYLKRLGVTAVELLPVTEWDETDCRYINPFTGARLRNYWGYNPISFLALRSGLAADPGRAPEEFKELVRRLHQAGIEVILDLVFNHTGESDLSGHTSGFRAIDNEVYYLTGQENGYQNYSGCGNTVNCNHPVVAALIIEALRHFVTEFHVDGFRFDLAAVFCRDTSGRPLDHAPLIEMIAEEPLLRDCKIIAEAWDAAGLYRVGSFSDDPRWREWNGRFRDDVRRFLAGATDTVRTLATRVAGSSDLYRGGEKSPLNSVNFLTSHDGFTLYDLLSYEHKRNEANGEQNRDGEEHNLSWNSGFEGDPAPAEIARLRLRRLRTSAALLLVSQGIPMICAGDEWGRTQGGNNNAWCQDNETSWLDWSLAEANHGLLRFFRKCIELRQAHALFRRTSFFVEDDGATPAEVREISWQSLRPGHTDWSPGCRSLAFLLSGNASAAPGAPSFFIMVNGSREEARNFLVPPVPGRAASGWARIVDTGADSPADFVTLAEAEAVRPGAAQPVEALALVILQSRDQG